ncbi:MAG: TetR/AcrR family transcriptional regulator C-terminal domain-containing protein [Pseudolysinimonas sp.]
MKMADKAGLEVLTMRKLGEALGVEAMSLYNHVANKEGLVDGMIDIVFSEIELPGNEPWALAMRRRATSLRDVLSRHRWAVGLMETRRNPGPANLRHHDAVLGSLRGAGFSIDAAAHAYSLMDSYIYGFAQTQMNLPLETPAQIAEVGNELLRQFPVDEYPHLAEMIEHAMKPGYNHSSEFEFGLDVVLEGLGRTVRSARST